MAIITNARVSHITNTAKSWKTSRIVIHAGGLGIESDTGRVKIGDGSSLWNDLIYTSESAAATPYDGSGVGSSATTVQDAMDELMDIYIPQPAPPIFWDPSTRQSEFVTNAVIGGGGDTVTVSSPNDSDNGLITSYDFLPDRPLVVELEILQNTLVSRKLFFGVTCTTSSIGPEAGPFYYSSFERFYAGGCGFSLLDGDTPWITPKVGDLVAFVWDWDNEILTLWLNGVQNEYRLGFNLNELGMYDFDGFYVTHSHSSFSDSATTSGVKIRTDSSRDGYTYGGVI